MEKKTTYVPVLGTVNAPDFKFIPLPIFKRSLSKRMAPFPPIDWLNDCT